ncbi:MAG: HAD family hydrolase [Succinivibrio sp.]
MRFDTVLFDLDGTLFDTAPDIYAACNRTLEEFGYAKASEELLGPGLPYGMRAMLRLALPQRDWPKAERGSPMYREFDRLYTQNSHELTRPFPGIEKLVLDLGRCGIRTGVVTNKYMHMVRALFAAFPFTSQFKSVVGGDSASKAKPDPEPIWMAARECGSEPSRTLYVGDLRSDVDAARNAGAASCAVEWGYGLFMPQPLEDWGAQHVARDPSDILEIARG